MWTTGAQTLGSSSAAFPRLLTRSWIRSGATQASTHMGHCHHRQNLDSVHHQEWINAFTWGAGHLQIGVVKSRKTEDIDPFFFFSSIPSQYVVSFPYVLSSQKALPRCSTSNPPELEAKLTVLLATFPNCVLYYSS